jgi:hypothetical protein
MLRTQFYEILNFPVFFDYVLDSAEFLAKFIGEVYYFWNPQRQSNPKPQKQKNMDLSIFRMPLDLSEFRFANTTRKA